MATGRKKRRGVVFGAVRFFKGASCTSSNSDEAACSTSPSDSTSVSIPMTSLETLSTSTDASMTSQSSGPSSDESRWFLAVQNNELTIVNGLLSQGANVNAICSSDGWSALHVAAWNGWIDLTQLLIASGCDLNIAGPGGVTPLVLASQRGHVIVVRSLICAGCDVTKRAEFRMAPSVSSKSKTTRGSGGFLRCRHVTAVHLAARYGHVGVLRCLVSAGAAIDAPMTVAEHVGGVTPLHLAVEAGHIDVIDYLIAAGSDVNTSTRAPTGVRSANDAVPLTSTPSAAAEMTAVFASTSRLKLT